MPRERNPRSLTACANVKVSADELQEVKRRATADGLTVSEWGRTTLLRAFHVDPVTRTMMAEFLAMRRIVLTLYTELRKGGKELSPAAIDHLVEDTEYRKYAMADRRIRDTLHLPVVDDPASFPISKSAKEKKA